MRIGPYEAKEELGRGGMGRVLRAVHVPTGAVRALKLLGETTDVDALVRFRAESQALARLADPGIVQIHESGTLGRTPWFAMDLLSGGSLALRMQRGPMPWREATSLVIKLARAAGRCHAAGLVHRDIKPANILFDDRGEPRLADFGCVRDLGATRLTATGALIGTPAYMAPEQLAGRAAGPPADVFSLGVILHELVSGEPPREWSKILELFRATTSPKRSRLAERFGAPARLDRLLDEALDADPARRPGDGSVLAARLAGLLEGKGLEPGARRAFVLGLALAVAALTAVALAVLAAASGPVREPETREAAFRRLATEGPRDRHRAEDLALVGSAASGTLGAFELALIDSAIALDPREPLLRRARIAARPGPLFAADVSLVASGADLQRLVGDRELVGPGADELWLELARSAATSPGLRKRALAYALAAVSARRLDPRRTFETLWPGFDWARVFDLAEGVTRDLADMEHSDDPAAHASKLRDELEALAAGPLAHVDPETRSAAFGALLAPLFVQARRRARALDLSCFEREVHETRVLASPDFRDFGEDCDMAQSELWVLINGRTTRPRPPRHADFPPAFHVVVDLLDPAGGARKATHTGEWLAPDDPLLSAARVVRASRYVVLRGDQLGELDRAREVSAAVLRESRDEPERAWATRILHEAILDGIDIRKVVSPDPERALADYDAAIAVAREGWPGRVDHDQYLKAEFLLQAGRYQESLDTLGPTPAPWFESCFVAAAVALRLRDSKGARRHLEEAERSFAAGRMFARGKAETYRTDLAVLRDAILRFEAASR
jgi:hypothetical protein